MLATVSVIGKTKIPDHESDPGFSFAECEKKKL